MDNLVKDNLLITIGRAKMYSALFNSFYSIYNREEIPKENIEALEYLIPEIEEEITKITTDDVHDYRGIKTCDELLGKVYPQIMEEFYENYGFQVKELPPDHLITQLAFMSKLLSDEIQALQREDKNKALTLKIIQHRLLATHMLRILKTFEKLKPFYELIKMDKSILFMELKDEIRQS